MQVMKKAEWAIRWTNKNNAAFAERLVAFAAVEGACSRVMSCYDIMITVTSKAHITGLT